MKYCLAYVATPLVECVYYICAVTLSGRVFIEFMILYLMLFFAKSWYMQFMSCTGVMAV